MQDAPGVAPAHHQVVHQGGVAARIVRFDAVRHRIRGFERNPAVGDIAEVLSALGTAEDNLSAAIAAGDSATQAALTQAVSDLEAAEDRLSAFRSELFRAIDVATTELIARYREQPLLALQILPTDPYR